MPANLLTVHVSGNTLYVSGVDFPSNLSQFSLLSIGQLLSMEIELVQPLTSRDQPTAYHTDYADDRSAPSTRNRTDPFP